MDGVAFAVPLVKWGNLLILNRVAHLFMEIYGFWLALCLEESPAG